MKASVQKKKFSWVVETNRFFVLDKFNNNLWTINSNH